MFLLFVLLVLFTVTIICVTGIILLGVRSLVVERRTAERAAGVRFPTCVPLARIQNRYGIPTGQFGSCPISIWRPGVLGLSSQAPKRSWRRGKSIATVQTLTCVDTRTIEDSWLGNEARSSDLKPPLSVEYAGLVGTQFFRLSERLCQKCKLNETN